MQQLFQAPGFDVKMLVTYRSCVLYLWIQTLVLVKSQDCSLQDFISSPLFDPNANISSLEASYPDLTRVIVSCNDGYSGSIKLICDEGEWTSNGIKCQAGIKCPAPVIENGHITGEVRVYEENEVLHFECDRYYEKESVIPSKCLKVGNSAAFSPSPVCIGGVCFLPFNQISSYNPPNQNVFRPNDTVTVSCGRMHYIKTPQTTSAVSTCDEYGNWDITPECQEVRCSGRPVPPVTSLWHLGYGKQQGIYRMDDTVGYRCQSGYRAASNRATCTRDGWAPDPLCEGQTCVKKEVQNAEIRQGYDKPTYIFGEQVRYVCKEGYEGEFTLTCTGPEWSGNARCTEAGCDKVNIAGATITQNNWRSYRHGDIFRYTCDGGPQQSITVTCNKGNWEGIKSCTGCDKLEIPKGFAVAQGDEKAYYTCNDNYKLSTKGWWNEAECKNSEWNRHPTCIVKNNCGELPEIPNGELRRQGVTTPPIIRIVCEAGYSTQAQPPTCQNGNWDFGQYAPETLCTASPSACDPPPRVQYAVIESKYQEKYNSGTQLSYRCADGYRMEGNRWIRCADGQWDQGRSTTCTPLND